MIYNTLYDWQKQIVDKVKSRDSYGVFLDCGLGKTPVCLALAEANNCDKIIVITINSKATEDTSVPGSWLWWGARMDKPYLLRNKKSKDTSGEDPEIMMINYEALYERNNKSGIQLKKPVKDFIKSCSGKNVAIIVDESHKMKDIQSIQTKCIYQLKRELIIKSRSVHCYLATGTPFTKDFIDLYSQLKFLGCDITKTEFIDRFCVRANIPGLLGWQQPIKSYKNLDELYDMVHRYAITMKSSDVIKLPEQIFIDHVGPISEEFKMFTSDKVRESRLATLIGDPYEENDRKVNNPFYRNIAFPEEKWIADTPANFWLRCRQLSIGFQGNAEESVWYDRSRLNMLEKFLSENEDNYVLFYNYTPELIELYDICDKLGYKVDVYCGEMKSLSYYEIYESQSPEERLTNTKNIILSNYASGSTGKNWQLYNQCILFSIALYKDYEQAIKRVHRIGQDKPVIYHSFVQSNFLDTAMLKALSNKEDYNDKMFTFDIARIQGGNQI